MNLSDLPLFAEPRTDTAESLLEQLTPIARELMRQRGSLAAWEIREEAEKRGLLDGRESRELLSALGALPRRMGWKAVGVERSPHRVARSHANRNTRWEAA